MIFGFLLGCGIHALTATMAGHGIDAALDVATAKSGLLIVEPWIVPSLERLDASRARLESIEAEVPIRGAPADPEILRRLREAQAAFRLEQSSVFGVHEEWREQWERHGRAGFRTRKDVQREWAESGRMPLLPVAIGVLLAGLWFLMLAFQGEGLELDFQRRRHPMWEWLLSHPVQPGAVFAAEMLAPLAANPFLASGPVFWIVCFANQYGMESIPAGLVAGVLASLAGCCFSKAIEMAALVRLSPRTRGAFLGILSWLGYASLFAVVLLSRGTGWLEALAKALDAGISWIAAGHEIFLPMAGLSAWASVATISMISLGICAFSVWCGVWSTNRGLSGNFGGGPAAPVVFSAKSSARWLKDPLHRKEMLWFWRDRGAVVQVILVPLTMAAFQAINLRGLFDLTEQSWNVFAGLAVLFGTYFLFILGPRSLVSEGPALWIPLTWPRSLESLLKAKARLWWAISTVLVGIALGGSLLLYPSDRWKILLVGAGWILFSGSLAEKTVTLVSIASNSGETEPLPAGRRWAASLGTFTFAIGIMSQQWALAFTGVVYSWITSAALWQNFRARLPYLFDPWSEQLPPPPTLMHAMLAISAMVEILAIPLAIVVGVLGREHLFLARAIGYAVVGPATWLFMNSWLAKRGVHTRDVWRWPMAENKRRPLGLATLASATVIFGVLAGLAGLGYEALMLHSPMLGEAFRQVASHLQANPQEQWWLFAMGVAVAPLAEEYLFRGLLYRALDREWGGWRAVVASAAFFAIYHPPASWLPVFALGCLNAVLFKRGQHLFPCVLVHAIYNALVIGLN